MRAIILSRMPSLEFTGVSSSLRATFSCHELRLIRTTILSDRFVDRTDQAPEGA